MRYVIRNMPFRAGLATAGNQVTIPESALWRAQNCIPGLDGLLSKRPGLWQWGQSLRYPAQADSVHFYEPFLSLDNWTDDGGASEIVLTAASGILIASIIPSAAPETLVIGRQVAGGQADSEDGDWSLRFTARATNMPDEGQFLVSARARTSDESRSFRILGNEIQYFHNASWHTLYAFAINTVGTTSLEFRYSIDNDSVSLWVNDVQVAAHTGMAEYAALTEGEYVEFHFASENTLPQYTINIFDLMFEGTVENPFPPERLSAGTDYQVVAGGSAVRRYLLVAGTKWLYYDPNQRKQWAPLLELSGGNVSFAYFGQELLIFDSDDGFNSQVYRWRGDDVPERMENAPPVRFGTEHRTRLFAAGDKRHPLRVYYTGSRQPDLWFAPDTETDGQATEDAVLQAGYINIPGDAGDEIVALYGDMFGSCIVATRRSLWRIVGSSPQSFARENVGHGVGGAGPMALTRVANDLWIAGRQGIASVMTVEQFGDMQLAWPSTTIADLWSPGLPGASVKVDQFQAHRTSMAWNPNLSLVYFAFARQGATDVSSIYVHNPATQQWMGPWETNTTFVKTVELATPITQVVMHGTSDGRVGVTDNTYKADFAEPYTVLIESPYLCGRSVSPELTERVKTWKLLRLFIHPVGDWPIIVRWQVDNDTWQTRVESQNIYDAHTLGVDWRIGDDPGGMIHSRQMAAMLEFPLDARGQFLKFTVETDTDVPGADLLLEGYEVEFTIGD